MTTKTWENDQLAETLRDVMAGVCTPVAVVTSRIDDVPFGSTVSAFSSLSMDPPMLMIALNRGSETLKAVTTSRRFGVNVLGSDNAELAMTFARKGTDKFSGVEWHYEQDAPRILATAGWIACAVDTLTEGGDHVIISGHVLDAALDPAAPLTYHRRRFGTHTPFPESM